MFVTYWDSMFWFLNSNKWPRKEKYLDGWPAGKTYFQLLVGKAIVSVGVWLAVLWTALGCRHRDWVQGAAADPHPSPPGQGESHHQGDQWLSDHLQGPWGVLQGKNWSHLVSGCCRDLEWKMVNEEVNSIPAISRQPVKIPICTKQTKDWVIEVSAVTGIPICHDMKCWWIHITIHLKNTGMLCNSKSCIFSSCGQSLHKWKVESKL